LCRADKVESWSQPIPVSWQRKIALQFEVGGASRIEIPEDIVQRGAELLLGEGGRAPVSELRSI
jgi:hypothetical protein